MRSSTAITMDAVLSEIVAAPENDEPRQVWADAHPGVHGELVAIQCALSRGDRSIIERAELRHRQRTILALHGVDLSGLRGIAMHCRFRRGFVEQATFTGEQLLAHADQIFAAAPLLQMVAIEDADDGQLAAILALPHFAQVRGLGLPYISNDVTQTAAANGVFARLQTLSVPRLGPWTVEALEASGDLKHIRRAWVSHHSGIGLFALMPALRAADISFVEEPERAVPTLPASLRELVIQPSGLDALIASPLAAELERLMVTTIDPIMLSTFAAFPKLRSLSVACGQRLDGPAWDLAQLPSTLRELRCNRTTPEGAEVIGRRWGAQLELLEINGFDPSASTLIAPLIAGDFFANPHDALVPPLFVGERPDEPMWDHPLVDLSEP